VPFNLMRGGIDVAERFWVSFRWIRRVGGPECWSRRVDAFSEAKDSVCINIRRKSENSMSVNTSVYVRYIYLNEKYVRS